MCTKAEENLERLIAEKNRLEQSASQIRERKRTLEEKLRRATKDHERAKAQRDKAAAGEICWRTGLIAATGGDYALLESVLMRALSQWQASNSIKMPDRPIASDDGRSGHVPPTN